MTKRMNPFRKTPKKSRGGQPGNNNAFKHGFYSQTFTQPEIERLDTQVAGEFTDEEALLRTLLFSLAQDLKDPSLSFDQKNAAKRTCILFVTSIQSIHRDRKSIYHGQTTIQRALQELKGLPFDQDWQPEKNEPAEKDEKDEPH